MFSAANGNAISVADIDGGSGNETVSLRVQHGVLTTRSDDGPAAVHQRWIREVFMTGTIAQLNAALEGMTYAPAAGYFGPDQLSLSIEDGGNTGTPLNPFTHFDTLAITVVQVPAVSGVGRSSRRCWPDRARP